MKPSQPLASQPPLAQNPPPTELAPLQPAAPVSTAAATTVPEAKPVASQPLPPQSPNRKRKSVSLNHTQDLHQDSMATSSTAPAESPATNANASASAPAPAPAPASVPAPAPPPQVEAGAQEPKLKKSRTNTPWTPAEELRLKQMRDKGHSWNEIAQVGPHRGTAMPIETLVAPSGWTLNG